MTYHSKMKKTKQISTQEYFGGKQIKLPPSRLELLQKQINYEAEVLVELPKQEDPPTYSYFINLPCYRPPKEIMWTHLTKMFLP